MTTEVTTIKELKQAARGMKMRIRQVEAKRNLTRYRFILMGIVILAVGASVAAYLVWG